MHLAELTSIPLMEHVCALAYVDREGVSQRVIAKMLGVQRATVQLWETQALRRKELVKLADPYREPTMTLNERIEQVVRRGYATAAEVAYIAGCSTPRALEYLNEMLAQGVVVALPGSRNTPRTWRMAE
jgi:transposase